MFRLGVRRALPRTQPQFLRGPVTPFRILSAMSTNADTKPQQHLFVIWAPDYTDEEAINRRLAVREKHLEVSKENVKAGYVTAVNGPLLSPESIASTDAPKKMVGSMLVVRGTSVEEVRAKVETDVYWTGNVWDKEKLVILPYLAPSLEAALHPAS